jgi:hypothetical protein
MKTAERRPSGKIRLMNCSVANARSTRQLRRAALTLAAITLTGCGAKESYQVSGQVKYSDGSPITGGVRIIRFEPTDDTTAKIRKAASATIAEDGSFTAFTRRPGDGVFAGKYSVTFSVLTKPLGGTSLIPDYYTDSRSTPFKLDVDDDKTGLDYKLEKLKK